MRIRKCAARLLGTLPVCSSPPLPAGVSSSPLPPRSWDSEAPSPLAAGLLCELNRSPWDDLMCLELVASCDPEEVEDGGILGNGVKVEVEEARGILGKRIKYEASAVSSLPKGSGASMDDKAEAKVRKKSTAKARRKKKDNFIKTNGGAAVVEASNASCKKSDGKGWHCKRRAQHPHSLCHYHLAQLRSYSFNHSHGKVAEAAKEGHGSVGSRRKRTDIAGAGSNFYYYYSGFGPWRRKSRGGGSDNGDQDGCRAADEEDGDEILESGNGYDAPVAGDDEEDSEEEDGGDRDGTRDDNGGREGDRRSYRKRGRKRMKARSLKSLL